jgi:hypothetical protein
LQAQRGGAPRFGVIAWSLGNLATIMPTLPCRVGALLEIAVGHDAQGVPAFADLRAIATVSARGLGAHWLDGATLSLSEFEQRAAQRGRPDHAHRKHARAMLGSLLE